MKHEMVPTAYKRQAPRPWAFLFFLLLLPTAYGLQLQQSDLPRLLLRLQALGGQKKTRLPHCFAAGGGGAPPPGGPPPPPPPPPRGGGAPAPGLPHPPPPPRPHPPHPPAERRAREKAPGPPTAFALGLLQAAPFRRKKAHFFCSLATPTAHSPQRPRLLVLSMLGIASL
jgi:hypothetical protein